MAKRKTRELSQQQAEWICKASSSAKAVYERDGLEGLQRWIEQGGLQGKKAKAEPNDAEAIYKAQRRRAGTLSERMAQIRSDIARMKTMYGTIEKAQSESAPVEYDSFYGDARIPAQSKSKAAPDISDEYDPFYVDGRVKRG